MSLRKARALRGLRPGAEVEFRNAIGTYRARILMPQGTAGAGRDSYQVRILAGPDMHNWLIDLPASLITKTVKKRRR